MRCSGASIRERPPGDDARRLIRQRNGAVAALVSAAAPPAQAGVCGLPTQRPLWIEFGDGSVPFWQTFAKPGLISAAANFIYPPRIRSLGGKTVYWDMYLNSRRVGTPTDPADPAEVVKRAHRLFDYAAASSGCRCKRSV